jgi:hypothetical protein
MVEERRINPWTIYFFDNNNSAKYEPSCPVIPVINAMRALDIGVNDGVVNGMSVSLIDSIVFVVIVVVDKKLIFQFYYIVVLFL